MYKKTFWTIERLRVWIHEELKSRNIGSPSVITDQLLAHVFGGNRVMLYADLDKPATPLELDHLRKLVKRALEGEPVQYIVGESFFLGRPYFVNNSTLIPRASTETLVLLASDLIKESDSILEIGTGSGCISISLALKIKKLSITATDCSEEALEIAQKNAIRYNLDSITFLNGSFFDPIKKHSTYSLIVPNPPYIPSDEYKKLDKIVLDWEPRLALDGGSDGLDVARKIVKNASQFLNDQGCLILELSTSGATKIFDHLQVSPFWKDISIEPDEFGDYRIVVAKKDPNYLKE